MSPQSPRVNRTRIVLIYDLAVKRVRAFGTDIHHESGIAVGAEYTEHIRLPQSDNGVSVDIGVSSGSGTREPAARRSGPTRGLRGLT